MRTGSGAGCGPVCGLAAVAGLPDAVDSAAAFTTAFVVSAERKSAGVNTRPANTGMRIVAKKSRPTRSVAALTFDLGDAPSRCTELADQPPLKSASSE